ncbi:MAG: NAD(P)H-binding protein [Hyphomicrobiaceae bacterium]
MAQLAEPLSIVMLGATGAVGQQVVATLLAMPDVERLTLLRRRPLEGVTNAAVRQHVVDVFAPSSYAPLLPGHQIAICTLGVGQPSKVSREELVRVDKTAVLGFAAACKAAGIRHFQLLGSVGASAPSRSFFLRTKGELEDGLKALKFDRLSLFQPSMILTPTNRYGWSQGLTLAVWPLLQPVLVGDLRKFRGIPIATLGRAIAVNALSHKTGVETLHWDEIMALAAS